ncbi:MAG: P-II family nitrogen regulator [Gallicola sp.]|nr:P-II family nitrogen regulator [Gallicola sp.]
MLNCNCSLFTVIVDHGKASKVLKEAKKIGVRGGTILYGIGTNPSHLLHILELYEVKKEILLMIVESSMEDKLHEDLTRIFHFDKRNRGVCFSSSLTGLKGTSMAQKECIREERTETMEIKYEVIFVIVERGLGEDIVEYAASAGAKGATIIPARGSGIHENESLFHLTIEPEKEIVMMLVKEEESEMIAKKIDEEVNLDAPGTGVLFMMPVNRASGLVK